MSNYSWIVVAFGYLFAVGAFVWAWVCNDCLNVAENELERLRYEGAGRISRTSFAAIVTPLNALAADNPRDVETFELTAEIERLSEQLELTRLERDEWRDECMVVQEEIDDTNDAFDEVEQQLHAVEDDFCTLDDITTATVDLLEAKLRLTTDALEHASDKLELARLERDEARDALELLRVDVEIADALSDGLNTAILLTVRA